MSGWNNYLGGNMKKFVEENYESMVKDLSALVKHNSVFSEDEKPSGVKPKSGEPHFST